MIAAGKLVPAGAAAHYRAQVSDYNCKSCGSGNGGEAGSEAEGRRAGVKEGKGVA